MRVSEAAAAAGAGRGGDAAGSNNGVLGSGLFKTKEEPISVAAPRPAPRATVSRNA